MTDSQSRRSPSGHGATVAHRVCGACYHVINRGNYRRYLFEGKGAAEAFERTLGEAAVRFRWQVLLMGNHFHLAVEIAEPNLSAGMKWLPVR